MTRVSGRYGIVLLATVVVLMVTIAMPGGRRDEAAGLVLQGLLFALTLRVAGRDRRGALAGIAILVATGITVAGLVSDMPRWAIVVASTTFLVGTIVVVARGAYEHLQAEGVTMPVVAAALSLYLLVGLLFATIIGAVAVGSSTPYFHDTGGAGPGDGAPGDRVYFSFITLTTTGFGDFTPATKVGRALAVGEVLLGQIYLVTVVGLLVGNLQQRRRGDRSPADE